MERDVEWKGVCDQVNSLGGRRLATDLADAAGGVDRRNIRLHKSLRWSVRI